MSYQSSFSRTATANSLGSGELTESGIADRERRTACAGYGKCGRVGRIESFGSELKSDGLSATSFFDLLSGAQPAGYTDSALTETRELSANTMVCRCMLRRSFCAESGLQYAGIQKGPRN